MTFLKTILIWILEWLLSKAGAAIAVFLRKKQEKEAADQQVDEDIEKLKQAETKEQVDDAVDDIAKRF